MAPFLPTRMVFFLLLGVSTNPSYRGECPVCYEETEMATRTSCRHIFCWECIHKWARSNDSCPMCRTKLWSDDIVPGQLLALAPRPAPWPAAPPAAPVAQPATVPAAAAPPAPPAPPLPPALPAPPAQPAVIPLAAPAQHEVIIIDDDDDDEDDWMQDEDEDPRDDDPNDGDYVP